MKTLNEMQDNTIKLTKCIQKQNVKIQLLTASLEEFGDICAEQADNIMKLKAEVTRLKEGLCEHI